LRNNGTTFLTLNEITRDVEFLDMSQPIPRILKEYLNPFVHEVIPWQFQSVYILQNVAPKQLIKILLFQGRVFNRKDLYTLFQRLLLMNPTQHFNEFILLIVLEEEVYRKSSNVLVVK
jgi:hypothetical protein